ncbi:FecR family protein [Desertivirga xinjiangensis]|uniref:FecR family protein n=1 Tax=Desertivirga xinjiangensis TaxID=539206 RepID=UPI00210E6C7A|nr:FecR domain-containing protein [Pedobacter xinjiangensis]
MDNTLWACIIKRLSNEETAESTALLDSWLNQDLRNKQEYDEIKAVWELGGTLAVKGLNNFSDVKARIQTSEEPNETRPLRRNLWSYGLAAAISAVFLLTAFFQFYKTGKKEAAREQWIVKKAGASKIHLVLPDSTEVWLNAGSEISFRRAFSDHKLRLVKLSGEGYFDVSHNPSRPFIVQSGLVKTTVYGTSFNIRAYQNERIYSVSVNSGKVGVSTPVNSSSKLKGSPSEKQSVMFLTPGQKLLYSKWNKQVSMSEIRTADVNSWLEGELIFDQTPLNEVFRTLERQYNLEIVSDDQRLEGCTLTARFKNKSIAEVLKTLKLATNIRSKYVGQTIYIEGGAACGSTK